MRTVSQALFLVLLGFSFTACKSVRTAPAAEESKLAAISVDKFATTADMKPYKSWRITFTQVGDQIKGRKSAGAARPISFTSRTTKGNLSLTLPYGDYTVDLDYFADGNFAEVLYKVCLEPDGSKTIHGIYKSDVELKLTVCDAQEVIDATEKREANAAKLRVEEQKSKLATLVSSVDQTLQTQSLWLAKFTTVKTVANTWIADPTETNRSALCQEFAKFGAELRAASTSELAMELKNKLENELRPLTAKDGLCAAPVAAKAQ